MLSNGCVRKLKGWAPGFQCHSGRTARFVVQGEVLVCRTPGFHYWPKKDVHLKQTLGGSFLILQPRSSSQPHPHCDSSTHLSETEGCTQYWQRVMSGQLNECLVPHDTHMKGTMATVKLDDQYWFTFQQGSLLFPTGTWRSLFGEHMLMLHLHTSLWSGSLWGSAP